MKKILLLLFTLIFAFSAGSCSKADKKTPDLEDILTKIEGEVIFEVPDYGKAKLLSYAVTNDGTEAGEVMYLVFEYTNTASVNNSFSNLSYHFDLFQDDEQIHEISGRFSKDDWTVIKPGESIQAVVLYDIYDSVTDVEILCRDAFDDAVFGEYVLKITD